MLIWIQYTDKKYDMVKHTMLDSLLSSNRLEKFYRSDGWVRIGLDKTRGDGGRPYGGTERRFEEAAELNDYRVGFYLRSLKNNRSNQ